ncbi:MAG: hypothetical protein D6677_07805 [Calditrichaeota bacterium]|nr:MAG: hypothetical protein D6677_07805 [Calditrichota bacterium]
MKKLLLNPGKIFKFAILFGALLYGSVQARNSVTMLDDKLVIHFDDRHRKLVNELERATRQRRQKMYAFFDARDTTPVQIYLTRFEATYRKLVEKGIPEWAQAVAIPERRFIVIKVTNAEEIRRLPQVFLHELAHVYLHDYAVSAIPVWLHEGVAQWLSMEQLSPDEKLRIGNALAANRLIDFEAMDSLLAFPAGKAGLAYDLAYTAVEFLTRQYGVSGLRGLLHQWQAGQSYDANFMRIVGRDFIDFEVSWYAWLEKQYRWMVLLNVENLVLLAFVVLFALALARLKWRNHKKKAQWQREDQFMDDEKEPE